MIGVKIKAMRQRPFIFHLIVAILTFSIGIASSALWFVYRLLPSLELDGTSAIEKPVKMYPDEPEIPTVAFCDLVRYPAPYWQKVVRTQAILISDKDGLLKYLGDRGCKESSAWIYLNCYDPPYQDRCLSLLRELDYVLGGNTKKGYAASIDVIGQFDSVESHPGDEPRYRLNMHELKRAELIRSNVPRLPKFKRCRC
jgi:hypothetical protein